MADSTQVDPKDASDPAVGDLAGALHEVSNALTVVIGWIDRAREANGAADQVERALAVAAHRAGHARDIVRRAIGAETATAATVFTVASVVDDALLGLEPESRRRELAIVADVDVDLASFSVAEGARVLQILTNLLLNAIAFSPARGTIRVEARFSAERRAVFSVEDEGPGVPPSRRETIFEDGVTTREGGAGIGLRHAAGLAHAAGGTLTLEDSARGARFELDWPIGDRAQKSAPPPKMDALALDGARVLLVEDDDAVIDLLELALSARGASVVAVKRHRDLAAALATGPFDAALFDISPIQNDVLGALEAARAGSASCRLVVISGSASNVPALPEAWGAAWVRKPFEVAEIVRAIEGAKR